MALKQIAFFCLKFLLVFIAAKLVTRRKRLPDESKGTLNYIIQVEALISNNVWKAIMISI